MNSNDDLNKLIKSLPHYWYRGEFVLTYDHIADKWCAGYGDYINAKNLRTSTGDSPIEAVTNLKQVLIKQEEIK